MMFVPRRFRTGVAFCDGGFVGDRIAGPVDGYARTEHYLTFAKELLFRKSRTSCSITPYFVEIDKLSACLTQQYCCTTPWPSLIMKIA